MGISLHGIYFAGCRDADWIPDVVVDGRRFVALEWMMFAAYVGAGENGV